MRGRIFLLTAALVMLSAPVLAEYPDDCLGPNEPSGSDCMDTTYEGCCDDQGRAIWCDGGQLFCIDCATNNPECGWSDAGFYDCGSDGSGDPTGTFPKDCVGCDPACGPGFKCVGGECVECIPDCDGKVCGADGCGGSCGECGEGLSCVGCQCLTPGCEPLEGTGCGGCPCEACVCEMDAYCCETAWDGICATECLEDCGGCLPLLNCGNGECVAEDNENCATCPEDCACAEGEACFQGACCTPDCEGKECGNDGCGGSCGECGAGQFCNADQACEDLPVCEMVQEVGCGDVIEGDTTGHENLLDDYSCVGWDESGPEVGFKFTSDIDDLIIVTIEYGDEADLDLFVLEGACTIADCLDSGNTEVEFEAAAGGTYYFVVDGYGGAAGPYSLKVVCISECEPDCSGGPCSDNGCKGVCPCETEGDICYDGECCTPSCEGKECGDDGCGGMACGECETGTCAEGKCHSGPGCEATETPTCNGCSCEACVCEMDPYCCDTAWDGICVNECIGECGGCPNLENCGDGVCNAEEFENCSNCADDCGCEEGTVCHKGECCTPSCDGKVCGDDGCGGSCGSCEPGFGCKEGQCVESSGPEQCLGPNEPSSDDCMGLTYEGCCDDLGRVLWCDNGMLFCIDCGAANPECGWQGDFYDCGTDGSGDPSGSFPKECAGGCDPACGPGEKCVGGECVACEPDCAGKSCGSDGCGGSCGECAGTCNEGVCHAGPGCEVEEGPGCGGCACEACVCEIDAYCCDTQYDDICVGICMDECGGCPIEVVEDCGDGTCGAGENCGNCEADCGCEAGFVCEAGECIEEVVDPCGDGTCAEDENCATCEADCACADGAECVEGVCEATCTPACDGKVCGDDGCNGSCGTCGEGEECVEGLCELEIAADVVAEDTAGEDVTTEEPEKKSEKSGCTTTNSGSPLTMALFLAMLLAIVGVRRFGLR